MKGWLLNNVAVCVMECISLCDIPFLCTLSASAVIEPSLHRLDFFLEMFYRDLFLSLIKSYNYFVKHAAHALQLMRYPCMCALTNGFHQPVNSASSVFPTKSTYALKAKLKCTIPKEFPNYLRLF